jgi:hypothetical protein
MERAIRASSPLVNSISTPDQPRLIGGIELQNGSRTRLVS